MRSWKRNPALVGAGTGVIVRRGLGRLPLAIAGTVLMVGVLAGPASADPTGAKKAFSGTADCKSAGSYQVPAARAIASRASRQQIPASRSTRPLAAIPRLRTPAPAG